MKGGMQGQWQKRLRQSEVAMQGHQKEDKFQ